MGGGGRSASSGGQSGSRRESELGGVLTHHSFPDAPEDNTSKGEGSEQEIRERMLKQSAAGAQ